MSLELISIHFPKAAGSSLAAGLRSVYSGALHLDYDHDPLWGAAADGQVDLPPTARAVHGHFRALRYQGAPRITFLREPVDNLLSIYFFWKNYWGDGGPLHQRFKEQQPTILEFAMYPGLQTLMSEAYFGGVDVGHFLFVGFHDRRTASFERLSSLLGAKMDPGLHVNRTEGGDESRQAIRANRFVMNALRDRLKHDVAFYERAVELWA